jgi:hypothetical protein
LTVNRFLLYTQSMKSAAPREWDFPAEVLLLVAIFISAERLVATGWATGLGTAAALAVLGTVLGLVLGHSHFERTGVYLLTFGYSLVVPPWALGAAQYPNLAWQEQAASLGGRLAQSFNLFFSQKPVEDPLLFIAFATVVYWSLGLHAGYALARRGSFLSAVMPAGIVLFIVQLYDAWGTPRSGLLAFYLFLCLLLLGRLMYLRRRLFWSEERVWLSSESITDLNITIFITSLAVVALAWLGRGRPTLANPAREPGQRRGKPQERGKRQHCGFLRPDTGAWTARCHRRCIALHCASPARAQGGPLLLASPLLRPVPEWRMVYQSGLRTEYFAKPEGN